MTLLLKYLGFSVENSKNKFLIEQPNFSAGVQLLRKTGESMEFAHPNLFDYSNCGTALHGKARGKELNH